MFLIPLESPVPFLFTVGQVAKRLPTGHCGLIFKQCVTTPINRADAARRTCTSHNDGREETHTEVHVERREESKEEKLHPCKQMEGENTCREHERERGLEEER